MSVYANLKARFAHPDWDLFTEVTIGGRRMDALAMARDRTYALWGFEVKEHRSDWLREVQNPLKALPLVESVDSWFVVAPAEVVKPEELPPGWGLLVPRGESLRIVTRAAVNRRGPLSREMVHRMVWQLSEAAEGAKFSMKHHEAEAKRLADELASGVAGKEAESRVEYAERRAAEAEKSYSELAEKVRRFSARSGVPLNLDWQDGYEVGNAVSAVNRLAARNRTRNIIEDAISAADTLRKDAQIALDVLAKLDTKDAPGEAAS